MTIKKTPHKWQAEIIAWANGDRIEFRTENGEQWLDASPPKWVDEFQYRVKPQAPETRMTAQELKRAFHAASGEADKGWRGIANAAIARAIADGDVVLPSIAEHGIWKHSPYTGLPRHQGDIESDPHGILLAHPSAPMRAAESVSKRAERDMTVAIAVRNACINRFVSGSAPAKAIETGVILSLIIKELK